MSERDLHIHFQPPASLLDGRQLYYLCECVSCIIISQAGRDHATIWEAEATQPPNWYVNDDDFIVRRRDDVDDADADAD